MNRIDKTKTTYETLFQTPLDVSKSNDPEFLNILQRLIFGEVFFVGHLPHTTREMITCTVLSVMQTLPQLKSHANAALNVGVSPLELREVVYQCAPFIGIPKTLNAINAIDEVFTARNISLPLENQCFVEDDKRYEEGLKIQQPLYGDEIKEHYAALPDHLGDQLARFLTSYCFGDFYTRPALDIQTRELLILCILTTLNADKQIVAHGLGNIKVGNSLTTCYEALFQCLPYIGFPSTFNAINALMTIEQ